jgi:hypothetical protein
MRLLTTHLLLCGRCAIDAAAALAPPPPAGATQAAASASQSRATELRSQLLERLFATLLVPPHKLGGDGGLRDLWEALQAEAICVLIVGMPAFFPPPPRAPPSTASDADQRARELVHAVHAAWARPAWCLLLFGCLRKQQACST